MPLNQNDHGDVSWAKLSEGWPDTFEHPYAKWVFANKTGIIPYGSYVLMDYKTQSFPFLRVENQQLLDKLDESFNSVRAAILNEKAKKGL